MTKHIIIPESYINQRLDQALAKLLPEYSRTHIQKLITMGNLLLNGQKTFTKLKIKGGEKISITEIIPTLLKDQAEAIPLNIVYEDESILIINKPIGMVVHPGAGQPQQTLLNALLHHAPILKSVSRAGILHRLDKDTSGLLLVAKTTSALLHLQRQLKKRKILREYQAIVRGLIISGSTIEAPIERHPIKRIQMAVSDMGRPAITHYRVMEKYRFHTRLRIKLETGRTHQIRVHMAYIKHPIVGDKTYGGRLILAKKMSADLIQNLREFSRQALHAFVLEFTHPASEKVVRFEIDLPDDMQHLIQLLREDHALHRTHVARS